MTAHARLSASSAHRWMACPGAPDAEADHRDSTSVFAEQGTAAHTLLEFALTKGCSAQEAVQFVDDNDPGFEYFDAEMYNHVDDMLDYVRRRIDSDTILMTEQRLDYSRYAVGGFGTGDVLLMRPGELEVIDLKYGKGVAVSAEANPQIMCYGLGALPLAEMLFDIEMVTLTIYQPRLGNIDEWELSARSLENWGRDVLAPAADATLNPVAGRVPGASQCRFCKAKGDCRALADWSSGVMEDAANSSTLTASEVSETLKKTPLIKAWAEAVLARATGLLHDGEKVPGWKLVEGRARRKWEDAYDAEIFLTEHVGFDLDEVSPRELLSPSKAEQLLGSKRKSELEPYIVSPKGAPTIAPESDKRPALVIDVTEGFDNVES